MKKSEFYIYGIIFVAFALYNISQEKYDLGNTILIIGNIWLLAGKLKD